MPFSDPTNTTGMPLGELEGALLLIEVHEQVAEIQTSYGPASPIRADVFVLDGPHKADQYVDTLIFPKVLIGQLRPAVGGRVLGRLGKGTAKIGQSAPWKLETATDADRVIGEKFEAYMVERTAAVEEPF